MQSNRRQNYRLLQNQHFLFIFLLLNGFFEISHQQLGYWNNQMMIRPTNDVAIQKVGYLACYYNIHKKDK
jgi:hypothetical protein